MKRSLKDLMDICDEFGDSRGWENNDPNQLIASIVIELGELAEHYQWSSKFKEYDDQKKKEISYEFVDILVYLLRLASKSQVDLDTAFIEKMEKLKIKYPINSDYLTQKELYRKTGKNKLY